jgi:penicillin-binding protein 1A
VDTCAEPATAGTPCGRACAKRDGRSSVTTGLRFGRVGPDVPGHLWVGLAPAPDVRWEAATVCPAEGDDAAPVTAPSKRPRAPVRLLLIAIMAVSVALLISLPLVPVAVAANEVLGMIDQEVVDRPPLPDQLPLSAQVSTMLDRDGARIGELTGPERREPVRLDEVPDVVIDAVLAIEDADFYDHNGVNHQAIARAAMSNVAAGGIAQGGSTITQQYVKIALLDSSQTLERKMHEVIWAVELERRLTKDEILERYLNTVYLGDGVYGFGTAADHYFSKSLDDLTIAEAALLAGSIQAPSARNAVADPDAAMARGRTVIRLMQDQGRITETEAEDAMASDLVLNVREPDLGVPFYDDLVKRVLYDARIDLQPEAQAALGETAQERISALFEGGLQIHTTLDLDAQQQAAQSLGGMLTDPEGDPLGAVITLDHDQGALRALALGPHEFGECPDDHEGPCPLIQTNPTVPGLGGSGRQPGSAFKPFVAAAALEQGASSDRTYDTPSGEPIERCGWDPAEPYAPRNFDDDDGGEIDMVEAMRRSNNVYFVKLARDVGVMNIVDLTRDHGVVTSRNLDSFAGPDCSIALGAADVFPLEMVVGYGVWANDGVRCEPYLVERILDRTGEVIYEHEPTCEQVIDPEIARDMRDLLRATVNEGGTAPFVGRETVGDVWGKTGTTNNFVDAWFLGSTPHHTTAAWVGFENPRPMEDLVIGEEYYERVTGGALPGRIFVDYVNSLEGQQSGVTR